MTNVLCDRHHAGLYRSMQLLCKRLGWNLYTPIGREWATEGYWQFGFRAYGDDRLAKQYLEGGEWAVWEQTASLYDLGNPEPTSRTTTRFWATQDSEFPDEMIYGVGLTAARSMKWSHIIATVDDNQHGFARFAQEVGAQYVYQVGNTNQYVDWRLDPLALVSSEVPILGRGIRYHQEMDDTRFRQPYLADPTRVSSFVNCFPQIRRDHPYIGEAWDHARGLLPRWTFNEYGIDGADGILKPLSLLADTMALSGWVWMDKPTGDGFGHVIHQAAAIGRPIIGHASHYRGKMAEVFWTPETSIDLDTVSVQDAARMMSTVAQIPERFAEMCHAIRAIFDTIDYDAEAEAIRDFLAQGAVRELAVA